MDSLLDQKQTARILGLSVRTSEQQGSHPNIKTTNFGVV